MLFIEVENSVHILIFFISHAYYNIQFKFHEMDYEGWVIILAIYWISMSLFAYRNAVNCFERCKNLQKKTIPEIYRPFIRKIITSQHQKKIIRSCFLRFPFQFFMMTTFLIALALLATIRNYVKYPQILLDSFRRHGGRMLLKLCVNIQQEFDIHEKITTPIIISNHSSWLQTIYYGAFPTLISSVAKYQLSKMPVASALTKYYRCILVKRESSNSRTQTKQNIKNRIEKFEKKQQISPLVIYPQGTVSNGKSLLQFKSGAFENLTPITILSFQYDCEEFDPQMADVKLIESYTIVLALRPTIRIKKSVLKPLEGQTVTQYQQRCRQKMAKMGNFTKYQVSYGEFKEFLNFMMDSPDGYLKML